MDRGYFETFLLKHKIDAKTGAGQESTHTRIPDKTKKLQIFGGNYRVPVEQWHELLKKYYQHVFVKKNHEYLTEAQLQEDGPVLVDLDLKYAPSVEERLHTPEHIFQTVVAYAECLLKLLDIRSNEPFNIFVMEKKNVNTFEFPGVKTKDGVHILIGIKMSKAVQVLLHEMVLPELAVIWEDLPLTNDWADIMDMAVTKGHSNWMMYGSRKPHHEPYLLTYHYVLTYDEINLGQPWILNGGAELASKFDLSKDINLLSARYTKNITFPLRPEYEEAMKTAKNAIGTRKANNGGTRAGTGTGAGTGAGAGAGTTYRMLQAPGSADASYANISSETELDASLQVFLQDLDVSQYRFRETHEYTMILPSKYYALGEGSYLAWTKVGMALANTFMSSGGNLTYKTGPSMFLTFLKFSCQAPGFDWRTGVQDLYKKWKGFQVGSTEGLTHRSIMFWAKADAPEKYEAIRKTTIHYHIEQAIKHTPTEFDLANVLYVMFKDKFVCAGIKKNTWFQFIEHRWLEVDSANELRLAISKELSTIFQEKYQELVTTVLAHDANNEDEKELTKHLSEILTLLKKTVWKDHIMKEAKELFYDKDFFYNLDENPYLMCFANGVVDLKTCEFRRGFPDDYLSKCTGVNYIKDADLPIEVVKQINEFMAQLFPDADLRQYMWQHLASCLFGENINQTFNIYQGSGRNGKSILTELFAKGLGDYAGIVPVTLITQKRTTLGAACSEVAQLKGLRYALMQEPSKGEHMNEGIMKELTGGDQINARALYQDAITFRPQFTIVMTTNNDFEDISNDDATWRRIRKIDFVAKFLDNPNTAANPNNNKIIPFHLCPHQFPIDRKLKEKFPVWAPVFMTMLVKIAFKTKGSVTDCAMVLKSSEALRKRQDYFMQFCESKLEEKLGEYVKVTKATAAFKTWFLALHDKKSLPKGKDLTDYMDVKYGPHQPSKGWRNLAIVVEDAEED